MLRLLVILFLFGLSSPVLACGGSERCDVAEGYYLASPPPEWDGQSPLPVVVFYHGWNSSPEGMFRNRAMLNAVHKRGAMLVAPYARTGYWRQIGDGRAERGRDELAYARAVMADLKRRWPIDETRVLASGFSRGASMVWNLACYGADLFTAYVPIAGGFWNSNPPDCPSGPVNLRHIHGQSDRVVAFDEIGIYNSMPIPEGMTLLRRLNACRAEPDGNSSRTRYECQDWTTCDSGRTLSICLHPKGHSIPAEWVAEGYDWMIGLEQPPG
ncbi:MAG: hypothetical protein AAF317_02930 [Pseudomonadota bacterium]